MPKITVDGIDYNTEDLSDNGSTTCVTTILGTNEKIKAKLLFIKQLDQLMSQH